MVLGCVGEIVWVCIPVLISVDDVSMNFVGIVDEVLESPAYFCWISVGSRIAHTTRLWFGAEL